MADRLIRNSSMITICRGAYPRLIYGGRGLPGPGGADATNALTMKVTGQPESALHLGPVPLPDPMSFTSAASRIVAIAAPAADWTVTIFKNGVLAGTATIPAGQLSGTVSLTGGTLAGDNPDVVDAVCPLSADADIRNPCLLLAG